MSQSVWRMSRCARSLVALPRCACVCDGRAPQNEIFDMVRPRDPYKITLQDLIDSRVGHTVVGILTDVHCFWQYDNREALIAHDADQS
jgi:hypothetical protein